MKCKIKEYEDGDRLCTIFIMRMNATERDIIETALKEQAGISCLSFETRARIVDMVRSINDPVVKNK